MRFDLTDLRLFLNVVEQGSLTRGAESVNLALASASERISGMEAVLGAPLFERSRRGVTTTAAGDVLARHARLILFQMEQMRGELRFYGSGLKGRIRLLCNTAALAAVLPQALCRFLVTHPDLSVDLEERPSAEIVLAIAEERADLGIAADTADLAALQTRFLADDHLVLVAGASHAIADKESVAFADVVREPFVGVADAALETYLEMRASRLGRKLNHRIRLPRIEAVGSMVDAGVGIAIVSESSARLLQRPNLTVLPLADSWAHRRLYLCARDFRVLTPQAKLLAEHLAPV